MKRTIIGVFVAFLLLCGISFAGAYKEGEIIVKFKKDYTEADSFAFKASAASVKKHIRHKTKLIKLPHDMKVQTAIEMYNNDPLVEYAEPNYRVRKAETTPNDTSYTSQWWHTQIETPKAWDLTTGSDSVIVAVMDTGVDYNHEDLSVNKWTNPGETSCADGIDNDGNGYIDDCLGWNFAYDPTAGTPYIIPAENNPMDDDVDSHGTMVAGIIGAIGNNGKGIAGVNWQIKIMPLKFLDNNGDGYVSDVVLAVYYAIDKGAKIINCSFTLEGFSQSVKDAVASAKNSGVLLVAAAGNESRNNDVSPVYPASYPLDNIVSVAATDENDTKASFSNYGSGTVHLAAPGTNIYSTLRSNGYGSEKGTSFSTPMVSGTAALLWAYKPALSMKEVREIVFNSTDALSLSLVTQGRLNTYKALTKDTSTMPPAPPGLYSALNNLFNITLKWIDNSTVESGYRVERKSVGAYEEIAALSSDASEYTDVVLALEGTQITYRVAAYNSNGISYSKEAPFTVPLITPSNLSATVVSPTKIKLTWEDKSGRESGYYVERKSDSGFSVIATLSSNSTEYQDESVTQGPVYYYRVKAFNATAQSAYSNETQVTTASPAGGGGGGGGCFIATAAFGSPVHPYVNTFRQFRNRWLIPDFKFQILNFKFQIPNTVGRSVVGFYYKYSPPAAEFIQRQPAAKFMASIFLVPVALTLIYPQWLIVFFCCIACFFIVRKIRSEFRI